MKSLVWQQAIISTPLGDLCIVADQNYVYWCRFADDVAGMQALQQLVSIQNVMLVDGVNSHIDRLKHLLQRYMLGEQVVFDVPVKLHGTLFQQRVWQALRAIPQGTLTDYKRLAHMIGQPTAARAVARANGVNPCAIIVPCHRVIRRDGSLCGYNGGIMRKKQLLTIEKNF